MQGWTLRPVLRKGRAKAVAVWGRRPVSGRGLAMARRLALPVLNVEDAFLRSLNPGKGAGYGLLTDRKALHFDAAQVSELEEMLATAPLDDPGLLARAEAGIAFLRQEGLSKYSDWLPDARPPEPGYVLVIDQTRGDAAIAMAEASETTFDEMLVAARAEHPQKRIVLRTHPVTASGRRKGHFGPGNCDERTAICADPVNPWDLLDGADAVYCVSSQFGFEAILAGHRPVVFGQPFYAGWGLTDDRQPIPRRTRRLDTRQLFAAAMLEYPVWYDPFRDRLCSFETVARMLAAEARAWRENARPKVCSGMKPWKHRPVAAFLRGASGDPVFEAAPDAALDLAAREGRDLIVWASKATPELRQDSRARGVALATMEDGFLRSVGLGADLLPPASLVIDDLGIYFDPTRESRLEQLIATSCNLTEPERIRARDLREAIVAARLSKYNTGAALPPLPATKGRRMLVPGQVEDDASIRLGTTDICTNLALLEAARAAFPDDQIIYKPHPDTERGLRTGGIPEADLSRLADMVTRDASPTALLDQVDVVWTMTSLMGFEGLLRGCEVHCLGTPFYAGWGLTTDHAPVPERRQARPDLDALTHAVLIAYPRYFDAATGKACPPEVILDRLSARAPSVTRHAGLAVKWLAAAQYRLRRFAPLWRGGT